VILVDSSVWIDFFSNQVTKETEFLFDVLRTDTICLGDLILAEVLQGFKKDKDFRQARELLLPLPIYQMMSPDLALRSSENYRILRKKGITVRKAVDIWIATFCIEEGVQLLFSDRDFLPCVKHLGLKIPAIDNI